MNKESSRLVIDDQPLQLLPKLAIVAGGANEAAFIQQIHYLTSVFSQNEKDGHIWVYKSYAEWHKMFPWLSERTIQRILKKLHNNDLIVVEKFSTHLYHNTLWYRVNYDKLNELEKQLQKKEAEVKVPRQNDDSKNEHYRQSVEVVSRQVDDNCCRQNDDNNIKRKIYRKRDIEKYKKEKSTVTPTAVSKTDPAELDKVIDYLNQQAKTHYRKNATNRDLVKARINEGYTIQDCMKVIDNKTTQWLNTEWEQYLRPRTLFQKSKFESYLNTKPPKRTGTVVKEQMPDYNQQAEQPKPVDRQRIKELSARLEKLKQKQKEVSS